jgi:hypothetical protein
VHVRCSRVDFVANHSGLPNGGRKLCEGTLICLIRVHRFYDGAAVEGRNVDQAGNKRI